MDSLQFPPRTPQGTERMQTPPRSTPKESGTGEDFGTAGLKKQGDAHVRGGSEPARPPISVSEKQLMKVIEKAFKAVQGPQTYLEFSIHDPTKRLSIRVHDQETGEIIREIPPEKTLDFVAKLWEMAGILIDERR